MSIETIERYTVSDGYYNLKDKLSNYVFTLSEEHFKKASKARECIQTADELKEYAQKMKAKFISAMGGIPYEPGLPLHAKVVGIVEEKDLRIEKIIFQSRPDVYVTANLYLPHQRKDPCGAVLFQCGHSDLGKGYPRYQRIMRMIASCGVIVLSIDPVGQGERLSYHEQDIEGTMVAPCVYDHQYSGNQCFLVGDSPMRYFIADAMRSIDYLQSRKEVDPNQIGATGSSGGGTMTTHLMVCDSRVKAAAPATFVTNRQQYLYAGGAQDAEQIWLGATEYGFDHHELLMCFAPKPLLILGVEYDFFPIEGTKTVYQQCKRFWEMSGKEQDLQLFWDSVEHSFSDPLGKQAASFFAKTLNGEERYPDLSMAEPVPSSALWCTKSGQVLKEYPNAKFIFDENVERFEQILKTEQEKTEDVRIAEAKSFLRAKIEKNRTLCEFNLRMFAPMYENGLRIQPMMWFSQVYMPCFGLEFRDFRKKDDKIPVTICLWDNGTNDIESNIYRIRKICESGCAAFVVDLSGMGKCTPHDLNSAFAAKADYGVIDRLTKDLFFLNDSLCALRLYELQRTIQMLRLRQNVGEISVYAKGNASLYAKIAQFLDNTLTIETMDGIESLSSVVLSKYYENYNVSGIIIPGLAKYF